MLRYLLHVKCTWQKIFSGLPVQYTEDAVDKETVESIQALAPGISTRDYNSIVVAMDSGLLFPLVKAPEQRHLILQNLQSLDCLIPSFFTFFENLKYLEPCCQIMKGLLKPQFRKSICQELFGSYWHPQSIVIECCDGDFKAKPRTTLEQDRDLAYWQLWLFAMRNFPQLTSVMPRKEARKKKPLIREPDPTVWHHFGGLAVRLSFRTKAAKDLQNQDPDIDLARALVDRHTGDAERYSSEVKQIANITKSLCKRRLPPSTLGSLTSNTEIALKRRVGRPFEDVFNHDRSLLYLPCIKNAQSSGLVSDITTFFAVRDMFIHFFGTGEVFKPKKIRYRDYTNIRRF